LTVTLPPNGSVRVSYSGGAPTMITDIQ
jgi:hypothetical protein